MQSWQSAPVIGQPAAQPSQAPVQRPVQQQPVQQQPRRIYGAPEAPKQPSAPSGYRFDQNGALVPIPGGPADPNAKPADAPSGYRYNAQGSLEPIPGGPAERSREGGAIPVSAAQVARESVGQFSSLSRSLDTFKDDFAGNTLTGGLENTTEALIGIGTPGQSEWWADFKATDNLIRNSLFGASLTQGEKAAYEETTISPRMTPEKIRANLARRQQIVRNVLEREKEFYLANGYKPEAVDALFSVLRSPAATAQGQAREEEPPAFGAAGGQPPAPPTDTPQGPDLRAGAGLDFGQSRESAGIAQGDFRREDNPVLQGVRDEYARRLAGGESAEQIIRWARSAGISPTAFRSIQEQVKFRDANPGVPVEQYDTTQLDDRFVDLGVAEQALNAVAGSTPGAFALGVGEGLTGNYLDEAVGLLGGNAERFRLGQNAVAQQSPVANLLGNITGGVGTTVGGEVALGAAGVRAGLPRALAVDAAYGGLAGSGAATEGNRVAGGFQGALAAGAGSLAGNRVGNALARVARGSASPEVNALRGAGVTDLTLGQTVGDGGIVGRSIKGVEDRLSGLPVVGDLVNTRRTAGLRQFNQAAFKKALEPIGGTVGNKVGQEAIEDAQAQVSQAFTTALAGKGAAPDPVFARDLSAAVNGVRSIKRVGDEVSDEIGEIMKPYANDPLLSGEALDDISRNLRTLKANYVASRDPLATRVGKQIDRVERAIFDLFDRQASGTIDEYRKARAAYRRLSTLEDAVLKAQNQTDNVFTPAQLGRADTSNTRRFGGKRAAARGDTPLNELQQAGQAVLPNRVPDSGTAGRVLIPLAAVGAGGASDASGATNGTGITLGAIIAGAYTRGGQRLLTKPIRGMAPNTRRRALLENPNTPRALGATGGAGSAALLTGQQ